MPLRRIISVVLCVFRVALRERTESIFDVSLVCFFRDADLLIVGPHTENFDGFFLVVDLVHEAVLDVDPT